MQPVIEPQPQVLGTYAYHADPLPDPESFREYNELLPGAANRILEMAEKEMQHRQAIESSVERRQVRGQTFGFILALASLIGALLLLLAGESIVGLVLMLAVLSRLIAPFFRRKGM